MFVGLDRTVLRPERKAFEEMRFGHHQTVDDDDSLGGMQFHTTLLHHLEQTILTLCRFALLLEQGYLLLQEFLCPAEVILQDGFLDGSIQLLGADSAPLSERAGATN